MSARTLLGLALVVVALTGATFAEEGERWTDLAIEQRRALALLEDSDAMTISLLLLEARLYPEHFTPEMRGALDDCGKALLRVLKLNTKVRILLASFDMPVEDDKEQLAKFHALTKKVSENAATLRRGLDELQEKLGGDQWEKWDAEVDKEDAAEAEKNTPEPPKDDKKK